jgi:hypothetical protein
LAPVVAGKTGHRGADKHDRLSAVIGESALDLAFDETPRAGVWISSGGALAAPRTRPWLARDASAS